MDKPPDNNDNLRTNPDNKQQLLFFHPSESPWRNKLMHRQAPYNGDTAS